MLRVGVPSLFRSFIEASATHKTREVKPSSILYLSRCCVQPAACLLCCLKEGSGALDVEDGDKEKWGFREDRNNGRDKTYSSGALNLDCLMFCCWSIQFPCSGFMTGVVRQGVSYRRTQARMCSCISVCRHGMLSLQFRVRAIIYGLRYCTGKGSTRSSMQHRTSEFNLIFLFSFERDRGVERRTAWSETKEFASLLAASIAYFELNHIPDCCVWKHNPIKYSSFLLGCSGENLQGTWLLSQQVTYLKVQ